MFSDTLKQETKAAHQYLEKLVLERLNAINGNSDYVKFLKYFYAYFSKLENLIAPFLNLEIVPNFSDRRTSIFLKKDILDLDGSALTLLTEVRMPEINNVLQALGALYVMEGSVMGGPYIIRLLAKKGITTGLSFYAGYGSATSQVWDTFISAINKFVKSPEEELIVIKSANETFFQFSASFYKQLF